MRHLCSYLMRAAGQEPALDKRQRTLCCYRAVLGDSGLRPGLGTGFYIDLIFLCVLEKIIFQSSLNQYLLRAKIDTTFFFYLYH